jgi:hypothetical protein
MQPASRPLILLYKTQSRNLSIDLSLSQPSQHLVIYCNLPSSQMWLPVSYIQKNNELH